MTKMRKSVSKMMKGLCRESMTRILISAGEASGDLHAGAVTRAIKQLCPEVEVFGMGGDCLRKAGGEVLFDIKDHSLMGFVERLVMPSKASASIFLSG